MPTNLDIASMLIPSVIRQESAGRADAVSPAGAQGIMQIMPATARDPGYGVTPLQNWDGVNPKSAPIDEQIRFGRDYLAAMNKQFGGDTSKTLAAYNAGPGAVQKYGGVPPYKETQDYVNKISTNAGIQMADNSTTGDWRTRAQPVTMADVAPAVQIPVQADAGSDWRSRAQPIQAIQVDTPKAQAAIGTDMGKGGAFASGLNSAVPFGERIAAGLGAGIAYPIDKIKDAVNGESNDLSIGDYYKTARENQQVTDANHPGYHAAGAVTGIAATLPMASAKVLGAGEAATTGIRGAINEIPAVLQGVGSYVRGGKAAEEAGTLAKIANVGGKAIRSASVAAPTSAAYAYGASNSDLNSQGAVDDAKQGAGVGAMLGVAAPIAGAVIKGAVIPAVKDGVKQLAQRAMDDFGINLSMNQVAPGAVRDTIQKVSKYVPGSGVDGFNEKAKGQWLKAVAGTIGQDADNLGPATINKFLDDTSTKFENVLKGKTITPTYDPLKEISAITSEAGENITKDYADIVGGKADNITKQLFTSRTTANGVSYAPKQITGEKLASIRSQLIKSLPNVAGDAKHYVGQLVDVIDNIASKNLPPDALEQLGQARREWRNFRTIEPLLEKSTDGTISPSALMQRVASSKYIKASRTPTGTDDLVDLARIGKQFMTSPGGSDTAQKLAYMKGAADLGTVAGAVTLPTKVIPAMLLNRGYQKVLNQSQSLVGKAVSGGPKTSNAVPIADMLGVQATPQLTKSPRTEVTVTPPTTGKYAAAWRNRNN